MSTIREPPSAVSSRTRPAGSARTSPTIAASRRAGAHEARRAPRPRPPARRPRSACLRSPRRAGRCRGSRRRRPRSGERAARSRRARPPSPDAVGELVERGREAAARRVAHPAQPAEVERAPPRARARSGVALDLGLEREVAAGDHHRHAVVGERAGEEHAVARPNVRRAELDAVGDGADAGRRHVEPVRLATLDDLRVAGDDRDARLPARPRPSTRRSAAGRRSGSPPRSRTRR